MIKVNLVEAARKKAVKSGVKTSAPATALPAVLLLIVLGTAGGGYYWYSSLSGKSADLTTQISQLEAQKAQLAAIIQQNAIYEQRKKALENRITIIEGLKRNQVSPVMSLDVLSDAINRTQFVWLSSLDQNNTVFSMAGTGTSVNAIADFVTNLEGTGYFRNINLTNAQDASGNFSFSMTCEFSPPAAPAAESASISSVSRGN